MSNPENSLPEMDYSPKGYALSGKIMLSAIVVLFVVVILMVCLHIYARWYLLRERRRQLLRRNRRRSQLVFYVDSAVNQSRGLDASLLNSLPVHVYSADANPEMVECAVCISEFKENEKVRVLPKCNHSFHIECIDMWFHSHSTCPLCRTAVDGQIPAPAPESQIEIVVSAAEQPESRSDTESGLCASCQHDAGSSGTSSSGPRRKPLELIGITIDVPPRRNESGEMAALSSPASQAFKSPGGRMRALRRMLSRDRKSAQSSSTAIGTSCGEFDEEASQVSRAQTPR